MISSPLMLAQIHVARRSQISASSMPFTAFATIVSYLVAALQLAWGMTPWWIWVLFFEPVCSLLGEAELREES